MIVGSLTLRSFVRLYAAGASSTLSDRKVVVT